MNRTIVILLILTVLLTACGQYGELYAPSESAEQPAATVTEKEKDSAPSTSEPSTSEQDVSE